MNKYCLPKEFTAKFLKGLKDGSINPAKLADMETSLERREYLAKFVGEENAKEVNALFESKLLLKNQQKGFITWAKTIGGLKEKTLRDFVTKVEKLERALTPSEENGLLSDLIEQKLGIAVTQEEANKITELTAQMRELYTDRFNDPQKKYFKLKKQLMDFIKEQTPEKKAKTAVGKAMNATADVLAVGRAVKTGFDLSAPLRQGAALIGTKQYNSALVNMFKYAQSKEALDNLEVDMMAHKYSDAALSVKRELGLTLLGETFTQREEAFASKLTEKIPLLNASARAYEGFLNDLRFNRFVDIVQSLEEAGQNITDNKEALQDLAKVVGAATGRGSLGSAEASANSLATVLFSPRWLASRIQILTNPITKSGPARIEAGKSLARLAGVALSILGLAKAAGADVEDDPRSADFGKFKIKDTRFDLTGGMAPYIVLVYRFIKGEVKSSTTHKISYLNTGEYGSRTRANLIGDFLSNKFSPLAGAIRDVLRGEDFDGNPINLDQPTPDLLKFLAKSFVQPMLTTDAIEAFTQSSGDVDLGVGLASTFASLFGAGTGTYQIRATGKKWNEFKADKGEKVYRKAVKDLDDAFQIRLKKLEETPKFKNAKDEERNKMIDAIKADVTTTIMRKYK